MVVETKDSFDNFQFFHKFVENSKINSPHTNIIMDLLDELDMGGTPILRCKANLKFKTKTNKKTQRVSQIIQDPQKL